MLPVFVTKIVFVSLHLGALATLFLVSPTTTSIVLLVITYFVRMFAITGGFHRYFSHRTFQTSRCFQFILALAGCTAVQKGPIWWSRNHRAHHAHTDVEGDPHSPKMSGFFYSHIGWNFDPDPPSVNSPMKDLTRFPELRWLDRYHWIPPSLLAALCALIDGIPGVTWGFVVSTVCLYHMTFLVNSVCHVWGSRRFNTADTSRNNWWVAILTLGEGWHNNHHHEQTCTRQGRRWWEVDVTYYLLRLLALSGIIWGIREPRSSA